MKPTTYFFFSVLVLLLIVDAVDSSAQEKYGENQPFSSYWFIDELLEWGEKSSDFEIISVAKDGTKSGVRKGKIFRE